MALGHHALPDPAELVNGGMRRERHAVVEGGMAGEATVVDHRHVVADGHVVSRVGTGHPVPVAAECGRPAGGGSTRDRDPLAEHIPVADADVRFLGWVELQVLGKPADHGVGVDEVALAHRREPPDNRALPQHRALPESHVRFDHAERSDLDILAQPGAAVDNRRRMNLCHGSLRLGRLHPHSASRKETHDIARLPARQGPTREEPARGMNEVSRRSGFCYNSGSKRYAFASPA